MPKWREDTFVWTWKQNRLTAVLQKPCKKPVHQAAPTSLLTSCSLSGQACFLRVTPTWWAVPIVCRAPPSQVQIAVCSPQVSRHTNMPETSGFSTSLLLLPYNGILKEKLWVDLAHFQIIWRRFLCNDGSTWTINWELQNRRYFQTRSQKLRKKDCYLRFVCLSVWPSVRMDKLAPTGWFFTKFDIGFFFENLSRKFELH